MSNLPPPPPPPPPGRGSAGGVRPQPDRASARSTGPGGDALEAAGSWPRWTHLRARSRCSPSASSLPSLWPRRQPARRSPTPSSWPQVDERRRRSRSRSTTPPARSPASSHDGDEFTTTGGGDRGVSEADETVLARARRRLRVQDAEQQLVAQLGRPAAARAADHRLLRLDAAPGRRARWAT